MGTWGHEGAAPSPPPNLTAPRTFRGPRRTFSEVFTERTAGSKKGPEREAGAPKDKIVKIPAWIGREK